MRKDYELSEGFRLRLKALMVALERIVKGQDLSKIFAEAALDELKKVQELTDRLGKQKKG